MTRTVTSLRRSKYAGSTTRISMTGNMCLLIKAARHLRSRRRLKVSNKGYILDQKALEATCQQLANENATLRSKCAAMRTEQPSFFSTVQSLRADVLERDYRLHSVQSDGQIS